jgi:hypothetical protein
LAPSPRRPTPAARRTRPRPSHTSNFNIIAMGLHHSPQSTHSQSSIAATYTQEIRCGPTRITSSIISSQELPKIVKARWAGSVDSSSRHSVTAIDCLPGKQDYPRLTSSRSQGGCAAQIAGATRNTGYCSTIRSKSPSGARRSIGKNGRAPARSTRTRSSAAPKTTSTHRNSDTSPPSPTTDQTLAAKMRTGADRNIQVNGCWGDSARTCLVPAVT